MGSTEYGLLGAGSLSTSAGTRRTAGPGGGGNFEGQIHVIVHALREIDATDPLSHRAKQFEVVQLLKCVLFSLRARHVLHEGHDRKRPPSELRPEGERAKSPPAHSEPSRQRYGSKSERSHQPSRRRRFQCDRPLAQSQIAAPRDEMPWVCFARRRRSRRSYETRQPTVLPPFRFSPMGRLRKHHPPPLSLALRLTLLADFGTSAMTDAIVTSESRLMRIRCLD